MSAALQTAKDPAAIAVAPGHGSTQLMRKDMNTETNITQEHPWEAARRLTKELSEVLKRCDDGRWFANIMPGTEHDWLGFGAYPMSNTPNETIVDRVNGLAWELSEALNHYCDGRFQARIYPSEQAGYAVMFTVTNAAERRKS